MQLSEECSLTAHRFKLFWHNLCPISALFIFSNSSWSTPQLKHDTSRLPQALQTREGTEFLLYTCACMRPQENPCPAATEDAAGRTYHSAAANQLQQSIKNTDPQNGRPCETSCSVRSQTNHLLGTTVTPFFLSFSILCIHSTSFFSRRPMIQLVIQKFPNGLAPLLSTSLCAERQQTWKSKC